MSGDPRFLRINTALTNAAVIITEERESYFFGGCLLEKSGSDLVPRRATLRLEFRPIVHRMDAALAEIQRALAELGRLSAHS